MDYDYNGYGDGGYTEPAPAEPGPVAQETVPEPEPQEAPAEPKAQAKGKAKRRPRIPVDRILEARGLALDGRVVDALRPLAEGEDALTLLLLNGLAGGHAVSAQTVERVAGAARALDDERTRQVVAAASGRDDDVRLVEAVLDGRLSAPASLLTSLHDEPDGAARVKLAMKADARVLRDAVRAANLLGAPDLKASGNQMNVAVDLAYAASGVDVEPVRGLA